VILLETYSVVGLLFAIAFVTIGIGQVDPVAKGSGLGFRLIILPGVAALYSTAIGLPGEPVASTIGSGTKT